MTLSSLSNSCSNDDSISFDTDDCISMPDVASESIEMTEESLLAAHGYSKHKYLRKTLQGELFLAKKYFAMNERDITHYVAIKKISKQRYLAHEANDNGFNFIVDEDIVKEGFILRHLTLDNSPIGDSIAKYIDFIESNTHFYLIMEYIETNINLKEFVIKCHSYINDGKLRLSQYQQIIKYILWQLAVTIHWLHNDMHCVHLDIVPENIMLNGVHFVHNMDGSVCINPRIGVKLVDFGCSEIIASSMSFLCNKQHISLENEQYLAPNISKQDYYDASAADMWSFGMIIYFCFVGNYPYKLMQETDFNEPIVGTGYWAIYYGKLTPYLQKHCLLKYINTKTLSLINNLLVINETKRYRSIDVLKHECFESYYKRYSSQIERKSYLQRKQLLNQKYLL